MVIDAHSHYFGERMSNEIDAMLEERKGSTAASSNFYESDSVSFSTEGFRDRVESMDEWGLDAAVLSYPTLSVRFDEALLRDVDVHANVTRILNDWLHAGIREYPERFYAFASVPMVDEDEAIAELERAVTDLGLNGVTLESNVLGRPLHDDGFDRFFERADDLGVPILVHPTVPSTNERMEAFYGESMIGFPFDTTLAAAGLVFSGFMDEHDLDVILSHNGGALPYLQRRLEFVYDPDDPAYSHDLEKRPTEYLTDFWYDTAQSFPEAMELTRRVAGNRLVFGSDYPFGPADSVTTTRDHVASLDWPERERHDVLEGNLKRVLANA